LDGIGKDYGSLLMELYKSFINQEWSTKEVEEIRSNSGNNDEFPKQILSLRASGGMWGIWKKAKGGDSGAVWEEFGAQGFS
jgi:hypothetical protein